MRIELTFPEKIIFTTQLDVRVSDLNYGNHLGNDSILSLVHEARMRFLSNAGYSEMNVEGVGLIMADAGIQFKSEAFYGETIHVEIAINDIARVSFDLYYRLKCNDRIVAIVKTGMLFFDYENRKIKSVPAGFAEKFK